MVTINLLPQARKKRQTQLTHQDKMLMFVVVAVLAVLAGSYAFVRVTAMQETAHLADLNSQIAALADEQKLLDTNRALAQRSLAMEANLATAVGLQVNTNVVLDDVARDLPKACTLTQAHVTPLTGVVELDASSVQFRRPGAFLQRTGCRQAVQGCPHRQLPGALCHGRCRSGTTGQGDHDAHRHMAGRDQ